MCKPQTKQGACRWGCRAPYSHFSHMYIYTYMKIYMKLFIYIYRLIRINPKLNRELAVGAAGHLLVIFLTYICIHIYIYVNMYNHIYIYTYRYV